MSRDVVKLTYQAEVKQLRERLASIPDITAAEARKAMTELTRSARAMERAQKQSAQAAQKAHAKAAKNTGRMWIRSFADVSHGARTLSGIATRIGGYFQGLADTVNDLHDLSTRTGVAAETLAGLDLAARGAGLEMGDMRAAVQQLPRLMIQADQGMRRAKRGFDNLGVSVRDADGQLKSGEVALREILAAIAEIPDPTERAARAAEVFGDQGTKLLQALGDPSSLQAFVDTAAEFGADVGPKAAAAAAEWQRQSALLQNQIVSLQQATAEAFGGEARQDLLVLWGQAVTFTVTLAIRAFEELMDRLRLLGRAVTSWDGLMELMREPIGVMRIADAWTDAADAAQQYTDVTAKIGLQSTAPASGGAGGVSGPSTTGGTPPKEPVEDYTRAVRDAAKASQELRQAQQTAQLALMAPMEEMLARQDLELENLRQLAMLSGDRQAAAEAMHAVELRQGEERLELEAQIAQAKADAHSQAMAQIDAEAQKRRDAVWDYLDTSGEILTMGAGVMAEIASMAADSRHEAADKWFRWYQGVAIAEALANAGLAVTRALAGAPPPLNFALAATTAAAAGVQVAQIASQSAPAYHTGGIVRRYGQPDEVPARLLTDEAVLSRRGVAAAGGEAEIDAMNRGESRGGPLSVSLKFGHRTLDTVMVDYMNRDNPINRRLRRSGTAGHRRG